MKKQNNNLINIELFCMVLMQTYNIPHRLPFLKWINNIPKPVMILFIILSIPIYSYGIYTFIKEKNKRDLIFSILFFILFMVHVDFFFYDLL